MERKTWKVAVLGATGATFTKTGTVVNTGLPFRVVLAWTDAPGATTGKPPVKPTTPAKPATPATPAKPGAPAARADPPW